MSIPRVKRSRRKDVVSYLTNLQFSIIFCWEKMLSLTCADQVSAQSVPEVMEHTVPVLLHHFCMNVEA